MPLQFACEQNHSTKSALLKVKKDILLNMEVQKVTLFVLLDLSATFDAVRHDTPLNRLVRMARYSNGLRRTLHIVHSMSLQMMAYHLLFHSDKELSRASCVYGLHQ